MKGGFEGVYNADQKSVTWKFDGSYDPQPDRFDFDAFKGRSWDAEIATLVGATGQFFLMVNSFDILFTGPINDNIIGTYKCE